MICSCRSLCYPLDVELLENYDEIFCFLQAANLEAGASGIDDNVYQLTKHEFSSLGRGKYSGT